MKFKTKKYLIEEGEWRFFRGTRGAMAPLSLSLSLSQYIKVGISCLRA